MTWLIDTTVQSAPRFFGQRIYLRLATAFCALFALVLLAVWWQRLAAPGSLESAAPTVQLDAAPAPGDEGKEALPEGEAR